MKIAITVWGNRISPVFDSAHTILLADVLNGQVENRSYETVAPLIPAALAFKIIELHPDSLICGAISLQPAQIIEDAGIKLIPFISGRAEHVLQDYAQNQSMNKYCMPGCNKGAKDTTIPP